MNWILFLTILLAQFHESVQQRRQVSGFDVKAAGTSYADFEWDKYDGALSYTIYYFKHPQKTFAMKKDNIANTLTKIRVSGLDSGTDYGARITAVINDKEETPESTTAIFVTNGAKPVVLVNIVDIKTHEARVEWIPDKTQEYTEFQVFLVDPLNKTKVDEKRVNASEGIFFHTFKNLDADTGYRAAVVGYDGNLVSSVKSHGFRTGQETPMVRNVYVSNIELESATVNWGKPTKIDLVNLYEIQYGLATDTDEKLTTKRTARKNSIETYDLTGLTKNQVYKVRVRSCRDIGSRFVYSEWTDWQPFVTRRTGGDIGKVGSLSLSRVSIDSATVSWSAPTGSIASYQLQYYVVYQRPTKPIEDLVQLSHTLDKLKSGTRYQVRVRAVSHANVLGEWSTFEFFHTTGTKPVSSIDITEITTDSARVSWTKYTDSDFDRIVLTLRDNDLKKNVGEQVLLAANDTEYVYRNLHQNTPYTAKIVTKKQDGGRETTSSEVTLGFRTGLKKDALTPIVCTATAKTDPKELGKVQLSCEKPTELTVLRYEVRIEVQSRPDIRDFSDIQKFGATTAPGKQEMTVTGLYSGYTYNIYGRAVLSGEIDGDWSTASVVPIAHGRPPRFITIKDITEKQATVTWLDPYYDGTTEKIDKYRISWKDLDDITVTATMEENKKREVVLTGLKPDRRYLVSVSSILEGESQNGTAVSKGMRTGAGALPSPANPKVTVTKKKATLQWDLINNRPDVIQYEVLLENADDDKARNYRYMTKTGTQNTFQFPEEDVKENTNYFALVRGVLANNDLPTSKGFWSVKVPFNLDLTHVQKPVTPPERIRSLGVSDTWVILQWQRDDRTDVVAYEVRIQDIDRNVQAVVRTSGIATTVKVPNLKPKTAYTYQIRTITFRDEKSVWSPGHPFTTKGSGSGSGGKSSSSGVSGAVVAGIVIAVIVVVLVAVVGIIYTRRRRQENFSRFDNSVKFSKSNGYNNGSNVNEGQNTEMDDPAATAIKKGNKLYL